MFLNFHPCFGCSFSSLSLLRHQNGVVNSNMAIMTASIQSFYESNEHSLQMVNRSTRANCSDSKLLLHRGRASMHAYKDLISIYRPSLQICYISNFFFCSKRSLSWGFPQENISKKVLDMYYLFLALPLDTVIPLGAYISWGETEHCFGEQRFNHLRARTVAFPPTPTPNIMIPL